MARETKRLEKAANAPKVRTAASLFKAVALEPEPQEPEPGYDDVSTSSDSDLEELSAEVRRFEKMLNTKIGGKEGKGGLPGTVPKFAKPVAANGPTAGMGLAFGVQKLRLERMARLQNYDQDEEERELAAIMGEQTEAEKQKNGNLMPPSGSPPPLPGSGAVQLPHKPGPVEAQIADGPADRRQQQQKIVEETDEDLEIEIGGRSFLVDKESEIVFELLAGDADPPEVGQWNAESRQIVFSK